MMFDFLFPVVISTLLEKEVQDLTNSSNSGLSKSTQCDQLWRSLKL